MAQRGITRRLTALRHQNFRYLPKRLCMPRSRIRLGILVGKRANMCKPTRNLWHHGKRRLAGIVGNLIQSVSLVVCSSLLFVSVLVRLIVAARLAFILPAISDLRKTGTNLTQCGGC